MGEYALKSEVAGKGVAGAGLGTGIAGLTLGVFNWMLEMWRGGRRDNVHAYCQNQGLDMNAIMPLIMMAMNTGKTPANLDMYESKESANLREQLSLSQAKQYTDQAGMQTFQYFDTKLDARDQVQVGVLIEAAKNGEKIAYMQKDIDRLQEASFIHGQEICNIKAGQASMAERVTALAHNTSMQFDAQSKEFWGAIKLEGERRQSGINLEAERRECADNSILSYANATFVQNKKVIPAEDICPSVVTSRDVNNYYASGHVAATPQATSGTCCNYPTSSS